jgi:hypothetical protein
MATKGKQSHPSRAERGAITRLRHRVWPGIGSDVRTAARRLTGQPGATALTILTLALAIGVAAAVFSVVDQLILRPPPFVHADRLVNVWHQTVPNRSDGGGLSAEKIVGWQQQTAVFERLEAYIGASFDLTDSVEPERVVARVVSLGLVDMLGIRMHIGRPFAEGDGAAGSERVTIVSHEVWTARFCGSPGVIGSSVALNDERYTIIGVLRSGTTLLTGAEPIWRPRIRLVQRRVIVASVLLDDADPQPHVLKTQDRGRLRGRVAQRG